MTLNNIRQETKVTHCQATIDLLSRMTTHEQRALPILQHLQATCEHLYSNDKDITREAVHTTLFARCNDVHLKVHFGSAFKSRPSSA